MFGPKKEARERKLRHAAGPIDVNRYSSSIDTSMNVHAHDGPDGWVRLYNLAPQTNAEKEDSEWQLV